jgi:hypothetical protein
MGTLRYVRRFEALRIKKAKRLCSLSSLIALMMEAVSTSETSVNFYETTRLNISEDSHLHPLQTEVSVNHFGRPAEL